MVGHLRGAVLLAGAVLGAVQAQAASTISQSGFTPLYIGVDQETAKIDGSHADVVRVNLLAPGIKFMTTPKSGPLATIAEPLTQFVADQNLQFATNANFFAPCCSTSPQPEALTGLAVSQGHLVSAPTYTAAANNAVLVISRDNRAKILTLTSPSDIDLPRVYNAVAGSNIVVQNGVNVAPTDNTPGSFDAANPRTVVGLSKDRHLLYFVTIDGRIPGYSTGTSLAETGDLLVAVGSDIALNLDGGGSTEMVTKSPGKAPFIVNTPSGGAEREDGSAIGFTALPLPRLD